MPGEETKPCPFCGTPVKLWRMNAHKEYRTSRGSGQTSGKFYTIPGNISVLTDCPSCKASKKSIKDALDGKVESHAKKECLRCDEPAENGSLLCKGCAEKTKQAQTADN